MRIAVVNDTVYPFFKGGAQKRVYEISRRLVQRGHDVHWYGMDYGAKELEGIRLHAVSPAYNLYDSEGKRMIGQALRFALKTSIKEPVDIIDCMNFPYLHCFRSKLSAMMQRVPLVITWFEFWGNYWYEYMGKIGVIGQCIELVTTILPDIIIADSEKVKAQLIDVKVDDKKIRVIPDGVDTQLIASVEPSKTKYDVVYVGRLLPHKHVDVLLEAIAELDGVTAAIIGVGPSKEEWEQLSIKLGLDKRVTFLGHVEEDCDVYATVKSAKVLVLPSTQEGHPLVLPEANACGIPAIGIEGVCDEFVEFGQTGYQSPLLKYPLRRLIARAIELYPNFKSYCIESAKKYDWDIITDRVEAVYKELV